MFTKFVLTCCGMGKFEGRTSFTLIEIKLSPQFLCFRWFRLIYSYIVNICLLYYYTGRPMEGANDIDEFLEVFQRINPEFDNMLWFGYAYHVHTVCVLFKALMTTTKIHSIAEKEFKRIKKNEKTKNFSKKFNKYNNKKNSVIT